MDTYTPDRTLFLSVWGMVGGLKESKTLRVYAPRPRVHVSWKFLSRHETRRRPTPNIYTKCLHVVWVGRQELPCPSSLPPFHDQFLILWSWKRKQRKESLDGQYMTDQTPTDGGTVFTVLPSVAMTDPPPLIHGRYHLGGHVLTPKGVVGVGPVMGKGHYRRLLISNFIRNNMRPVSPLL